MFRVKRRERKNEVLITKENEIVNEITATSRQLCFCSSTTSTTNSRKSVNSPTVNLSGLVRSIFCSLGSVLQWRYFIRSMLHQCFFPLSVISLLRNHTCEYVLFTVPCTLPFVWEKHLLIQETSARHKVRIGTPAQSGSLGTNFLSQFTTLCFFKYFIPRFLELC